MYIDNLIWLPQIEDKLLTKHGVTRDEVEDVFLGKPRFRFHEKGHVRNEDMYTAMGRTLGGRFLIIFFLYKSGNRALIVSARDMSLNESKNSTNALPDHFDSIEEAAEFWDTHDLSDYWEFTQEAEFDVRIPERRTIALAADITEKLAEQARRQGVSVETLVNLWLAQRLQTIS